LLTGEVVVAVGVEDVVVADVWVVVVVVVVAVVVAVVVVVALVVTVVDLVPQLPRINEETNIIPRMMNNSFFIFIIDPLLLF